jgi:8-oxo-dGTP diphosphatase
MKTNFTIGAFAIITNEKNEVLLSLRNDFDLWNLPGGGVESGESPWECVVREVKEETGLTVKIEKLLGIYTKPDENDIVFNFKCLITGGELQLTPEAKQHKYFNLQTIPPNTSQKQVERIKDYYNNEELVLKSQTGLSLPSSN